MRTKRKTVRINGKTRYPLVCQKCGSAFNGWTYWQPFCSLACAAKVTLPHSNVKITEPRAAARMSVYRSGIKSQPCEICGSTKDLMAHHQDYREKLKVNWLCRSCHFRVHHAVKDLMEVAR